MAVAPRFMIQGFEVLDSEHERALPPSDLTDFVIERFSPRRGVSPEIDDNPQISVISRFLTGPSYDAAVRRRLRLPDLRSRCLAFAESVGGREDLRRLGEHRRELLVAERLVSDARSTAKAVMSADVADADAVDCYYAPFIAVRDGFVEDLDAARDWALGAYLRDNPIPSNAKDEAAWRIARDAWVDRHTPPFLFATSPVFWNGVALSDFKETVENLRDYAEDDTPLPIDATDARWRRVTSEIVGQSLEEHHETAWEDVVDRDQLDQAFISWLSRLDATPSPDAAFQDAIEAWNARQSVRSYEADMSRLVLASDRHTKLDAAAWAESQFIEASERFRALQNEWTPRAAEAA